MHSTAERPDLDFDFSVTSLRMYSVYGPGQSYNNPYQGVLGIFSGNLLRGEPITIFGDGEQTRDFVYIDDIVDGWMPRVEYAGRRAAPSSIWAAAGRCRSTISRRTSRRRSAIRRAATRSSASPAGRASSGRCRPTLRLAKSILGWEPKTPFETGLARTIEWARSEFAADPSAAKFAGAAR